MRQISDILGNFTLPKFEKRKKSKERQKTEIKNELIVQHNNLIEARYRLSLQEKRIIIWLLTQIKIDDEDFKLHRLEIIEFSKMIGLEVDNQYSKLQEVTLNLMKRIIRIYEPQTNSIIHIAWLSFARYHIAKGYVELRFDPELKPYLLQLKSHFTKLSLGDIMQLTSMYSMRFYELLKQYESIKLRKDTLEDLREYCGIISSEYNNYHDFKRYVLDRAIKEINEKTDIIIDYKEIKESRKIIAIEWIIKKKEPDKEQKLQIVSRKKEFRSKEILIEAIIEYGFSRTVAKQFLKDHEEEDIKNALRAVDNQVEKGKVKNPKAMLRTAIKEKWHPDIFKARKSLSRY